MFWRYNRPWNTFVIVYYKTLGTAFVAVLKHLCYLETGGFFFFCFFFFAKYLWFTVWKFGPGGVKRHKGSLATGKTLVWPFQAKT